MSSHPQNTSNSKEKILVGLVGQQNAGKSTIFNMLTGANQHIANYPGVTVDKKSGSYRFETQKVEVVDLPGTYSLTSFSLEERVARDFLLTEQPDTLVNVVDSSSLKRSLYFTFQVMEMGFPMVMALNMIDVAAGNGLKIDVEKLQHRLGVEVIPTVGRKAKGKRELLQAISAAVSRREGKMLTISYEELEPVVVELVEEVARHKELGIYPGRWLAVKLLEGDAEARRVIGEHLKNADFFLEMVRARIEDFEENHYQNISDYMVGCRDRLATSIVQSCVTASSEGKATISELIDRVVLNRLAAPFFLVGTVFVIYQLSIVKGYDLTQYWWPYLAKFRTLVAGVLPEAGLLHDPYSRSMVLWMVDSANTLLIYIPIFLILFSLIAILEDSGYMARIAFIVDKMLNAFGLHGQSTLPYILGGVFAGGCAVPGIMATKGIPDERSRLATILTVPYMNCLAKIPFYTLLVNIFFVEYKSWVMLFLSTITIFVALLVAKLLTSTMLRSRETAPFVMELPNYHPPTIYGVAQRALERTWEYVKKVGTIVVAVSVCIFTLLQFPGLEKEREIHYDSRMEKAVQKFQKNTAASKYAPQFRDEAALVAMINLYDEYKTNRLNTKGAEESRALAERYLERYPERFKFLKPKNDKEAKMINVALRNLASTRKSLRREIKEETITKSFMGLIGRSLEPVTQFAGFNWKINVALLSSFAARESSVATLGVLFQQGADDNKALEERMGAESESGGFTPLHALAVMIFFALYPPCLASTIMVKVQTNSYKWMLFSMFFPTFLGLAVSSTIFSCGRVMGVSGIQMMGIFYAIVVALTLAVGFGSRQRHEPMVDY